MDDGRGEDLPREAEGQSPATILWDIAGGGVSDGPLADPERAGERTWVVGVSTASERLQVLLIADEKGIFMTGRGLHGGEGGGNEQRKNPGSLCT